MFVTEDSISNVLPVFTDIPEAPNPWAPQYFQSDIDTTEQLETVVFDIKTQTRTTYLEQAIRTPLMVDQPVMGYDNVVAADDELTLQTDQMMGTPLPPVPHYNTTEFPYRTIVKILMRFNVNGENYFYSCSGFMASYYHVVTAGHCVFNFDPNNDGMENDRKWADEIWVFPGQTDWVEPTQCGLNLCADWPYGVAKMVAMRSYTGWEINHDFDHDWGVITLDRSIGIYTGWMGRSSDLPDSVNYSGYPGQQPYVPAGNNVQYRGFQQDNVVNSNSNIFEIFAAIYGGHSGGPAWKFVNGNRYAVGILSNGNRSDVTYSVRLNDTKRASLNQWIADDVILYPPQNGGELIEWLFDGLPHKGIDKNVVGQSEQLTFDYSIHNIGFNSITRNIIISFYATDDQYTVAEINDNNDPFNPYKFLLDQVVTDVDFTPDYIRNLTTTILIPNDLPAGDYNLAITYQTIGEHPGDLNCYGVGCTNKIIIPGLPLTVEDCPSDIWEDDNTMETANLSSSGNSRLHSICTVGDVDYVKFTVNGSQNVSAVFETTGTAGDTFLTLLSSTGELITFDNDSGSNQFSKIIRNCKGTPLSPGTYYLKVEEYGNDATIARYDLQGSITACPDYIFGHGFEILIEN